MRRLVLGTAQFQGNYGISRPSTGPGLERISKIVDYAYNSGITIIDTATNYGDCESLLGMVDVSQWKVITKLPTVPPNTYDITSWVHESVRASLTRLRLPTIHGLLLHNSTQLYESFGDDLFAALNDIREDGLTEHIGISIYDPAECEKIFPGYSFDILQAPLNIFDRRLIASGWLSRLNEAGVEVHARSVFLQGLLLMDVSSRPEEFHRWEILWKEWNRWLHAGGVPAVHACLDFVLSHEGVHAAVVGVDNQTQLRQILESYALPAPIPPPSIVCDELELIDPRRWDTP